MIAVDTPGSSGWGGLLWRDAKYWEKAWQEERRRSLYGVQQPGRSGREWWDRRAEGFVNQTGNETWRRRQDGIISMFERCNFLQPDIEVLDIGCGPGNYALPLAGRVKRVVALDPAPRMLVMLLQRADAAGITNIETVCATWEEVDLQERGWQERFGLVLAAMTPGINDAATLTKMVEASQGGCYYNGLAWCDDPAQEEVWRHLFQTEMPPIPADIFYVFHLLHAWGYGPLLELKRMSTRREMERLEAVDGLATAMAPYLEVTEAVRDEIGRTVDEMSPDGHYYQERQFVEGVMTWDVNA